MFWSLFLRKAYYFASKDLKKVILTILYGAFLYNFFLGLDITGSLWPCSVRFFTKFFLKNCFPPMEMVTSRVTHVTLVLWIGNETLRSLPLWERLRVTESWTHIESRQFIGWWRDAVSGHTGERRNDVVRSYWRTRHPLLRFLCRKESCRQREKLGSERSVSFPIQRTRVTWVTRDVLFHR